MRSLAASSEHRAPGRADSARNKTEIQEYLQQRSLKGWVEASNGPFSSRCAVLQWDGDMPDGSGTVIAGLMRSPAGAIFPGIAGGPPGRTTPEELLAASHATCYGIWAAVADCQAGWACPEPQGIRLQGDHARFDTLEPSAHPNESAGLSRIATLVVTLGLLAGAWRPCAGWEATAEARMSCCLRKAACAKHKAANGGTSTIVAQAEADTCCAAAERPDAYQSRPSPSPHRCSSAGRACSPNLRAAGARHRLAETASGAGQSRSREASPALRLPDLAHDGPRVSARRSSR